MIEARRRGAECPRGPARRHARLRCAQLGALAIVTTSWRGTTHAVASMCVRRLNKKKQFSTAAEIVLLRRVDTLDS